MTDGSESDDFRHLSGLLLFGILLSPVIFSWLLLRRGYSTDLRVGAFLYAALPLGSGLLQLLNP